MSWHISCVNSYINFILYQTDYPLRLPKRMKRSCFHEVKVDWLPVWTHFRFPTKNIGLDGLEYALTTKKVKRKSLLDWKE